MFARTAKSVPVRCNTLVCENAVTCSVNMLGLADTLSHDVLGRHSNVLDRDAEPAHNVFGSYNDSASNVFGGYSTLSRRNVSMRAFNVFGRCAVPAHNVSGSNTFFPDIL